MKVNVSQLKRLSGDTKTYQFKELLPPLQLGGEEYPFRCPLDVQMEITNTGKSLLVKGTVACEIEVLCSCCLKAFPYEIDFEFEDEFVSEQFAAEKDDTVFVFNKDEFSVDERIVEHILLHLPMRFVCSESCKGLCSQCGADLNLGTCSCSNDYINPNMEILTKWNKGGVN